MCRILWRIISGTIVGVEEKGIGTFPKENAFSFSFSPKTLFLKIRYLAFKFLLFLLSSCLFCK